MDRVDSKKFSHKHPSFNYCDQPNGRKLRVQLLKQCRQNKLKISCLGLQPHQENRKPTKFHSIVPDGTIQ
jgi:hypothetical protein